MASMTGFLLIDKPAGITSHDVVDRVRRLTGELRVGHAGTLDPFATGLLIVGVGRDATREMEKLVGLDKTYEAEFVLGANSDTDDVTGTITQSPESTIPGIADSGDRIRAALEGFVGEIEQVPPAYSAIKIGGKKMYEAARAGKPMETAARRVTIYSIDVSSRATLPSAGEPRDLSTRPAKLASVEMTIRCSSGTYIRAIARDLGRELGTGGYVKTLRRTQIGPFSINDAVTLETLKTDNPQPHLIPISQLLGRL